MIAELLPPEDAHQVFQSADQRELRHGTISESWFFEEDWTLVGLTP